MLESISASRSRLVGDLLGGVSSLAGLGGNFLGLVGLGEIAFLTSLFGALGGSLSGLLGLVGDGLRSGLLGSLHDGLLLDLLHDERCRPCGCRRE